MMPGPQKQRNSVYLLLLLAYLFSLTANRVHWRIYTYYICLYGKFVSAHKCI